MYPVGVHCSRAKRALTCGGLRHSHEEVESDGFKFKVHSVESQLVQLLGLRANRAAGLRVGGLREDTALNFIKV